MTRKERDFLQYMYNRCLILTVLEENGKHDMWFTPDWEDTIKVDKRVAKNCIKKHYLWIYLKERHILPEYSLTSYVLKQTVLDKFGIVRNPYPGFSGGGGDVNNEKVIDKFKKYGTMPK